MIQSWHPFLPIRFVSFSHSLSDVDTCIELLCVVVVGVLSSRLMVFSRGMAGWFVAAKNSSFDSES